MLIWIDQTFADIHSFRDRTAGYWRNFVRSAPDWRRGYWIQEECTLISDVAYRNCLRDLSATTTKSTGSEEGEPPN